MKVFGVLLEVHVSPSPMGLANGRRRHTQGPPDRDSRMTGTRDSSFGQDYELSVVDRFGMWLSTRRLMKVLGSIDNKTLADIGCGYDVRFGASLLPRRTTHCRRRQPEQLHRRTSEGDRNHRLPAGRAGRIARPQCRPRRPQLSARTPRSSDRDTCGDQKDRSTIDRCGVRQRSDLARQDGAGNIGVSAEAQPGAGDRRPSPLLQRSPALAESARRRVHAERAQGATTRSSASMHTRWPRPSGRTERRQIDRSGKLDDQRLFGGLANEAAVQAGIGAGQLRELLRDRTRPRLRRGGTSARSRPSTRRGPCRPAQLLQQVGRDCDDVAADCVGLEDVEQLAWAGPDQLDLWPAAPESRRTPSSSEWDRGPVSAMRPANTETIAGTPGTNASSDRLDLTRRHHAPSRSP